MTGDDRLIDRFVSKRVRVRKKRVRVRKKSGEIVRVLEEIEEKVWVTVKNVVATGELVTI